MKTSKIFEGKALFAAGALVCCMAGPAPAASPNDAWITSKAKVALMTTEGVSSNSINVDTVGRKVTLHGTVETNEEKQKAEEAVKTINGVTSVRNLLKVSSADAKATAGKTAAERADDQIAKDVRTALSNRKTLDDSTITVSSVDKGVVHLSGQADDMGDRMTAIRAARRVEGVRRVKADIQGPETFDDATASDTRDVDNDKGVVEKTGDAAKSAGNAVTDTAKATGNAVVDTTKSAADAAGDMYTTSMVKMRLLADKDTPAMDINVDTDDGVVTLFGDVPTATAKTRAAEEAQKVSGVKKVHNELQVVANAKQEDVKASDQEVASSVEQKLRENDLKNVNVDVKNCVVRLSGDVPTRQDRVEAMQVARATRGVCSVQNDLR